MRTSRSRHRLLFILAAAVSTVTGAWAGEARFSVMTYNVWKGWSQVDEGFRKGLDSIRGSRADIVGLQEASPDLAGKISGELGWFRADKGNGSPQIVSRFPIVESMAMERLIGARIRISESPVREIVVFNCHLDYRFYGPYAAMKPGATADSVLQEEQRSERAAQMKAMLAFMKARLDAADTLPVFLTGDFNSPSHLDWTTAASHLHGGIGAVAWSPSVQIAGAEMTDSFRSMYPDPVKDSGFTWSPIHKEGEKQDRIDFIYHKGRNVRIKAARVFTTPVETTVGPWGSAVDGAAVRKNTWPSDHAAIVVEYALE